MAGTVKIQRLGWSLEWMQRISEKGNEKPGNSWDIRIIRRNTVCRLPIMQSTVHFLQMNF